jgi:AraC-like DNA-binding protein
MTAFSPWINQNRITMPFSARGVAGVSMLGRYNYSHAYPALKDHRHRNGIEICFLVKGRQTYRLAGCDYQLKGGDVFISYPNEQHSTGEAPEEKGVLYWMVVTVPRKSDDFLGLAPQHGAAILRRLLHLPQRHFQGSWKMKDHLDTATSIYHQQKVPLKSIKLAHHVVAFLLEVLSCGEKSSNKNESNSFSNIIQHIGKHLDEPLSVPELATRVNLSIPRFKARFKQEYGIPPGDYVMRLRIEAAKKLLSQKHTSVTQVAYELGFSSSQYFATVFKRYTGKSPSALVH